MKLFSNAPTDTKRKMAWIVNYIRDKRHDGIDTYDSDFVDSYAEQNGAKLRIMNMGANKCRELSSLLNLMVEFRILNRFTKGIDHVRGLGMRNWMHQYKVRETSGNLDELSELSKPLSALER